MSRSIYTQGTLLTIAFLLIVGCRNQQTDQTQGIMGSSIETVGSDSDEHDCKPSAGYSWSIVKNDCIRLFEEGIRLHPAQKNSGAGLSAFVIFSEDKSEAEVFLPELSTSLLMLHNGEKSTTCWEKEGLRLFQKETLVLMKGDRVIFTGE